MYVCIPPYVFTLTTKREWSVVDTETYISIFLYFCAYQYLYILQIAFRNKMKEKIVIVGLIALLLVTVCAGYPNGIDREMNRPEGAITSRDSPACNYDWSKMDLTPLPSSPIPISPSPTSMSQEAIHGAGAYPDVPNVDEIKSKGKVAIAKIEAKIDNIPFWEEPGHELQKLVAEKTMDPVAFWAKQQEGYDVPYEMVSNWDWADQFSWP